MNQSKMIKRPLNLLVVGAACWRYWLMVMTLALLPVVVEAQVSLNVQNFGAKGDAVQFYANTVSNSDFVTTTNIFSTADIGKAIEVFNCGTNQSGTNCQDMITTIANVVNGTNIYLNQICQNTLTNTFATVGTDNSLAISNAIQTAIANGTNVIVHVPAGKYLCLASYNTASFAALSIQIKGGGWHLVGEGMTNSILIGQGGWSYRGGYGVMRGFLLAVAPPITNDYPVSIENLTLDGGVEVGNTSRHGFPASPVDGMGWDTTHDAIDVRGGGTSASFTHWTWTNVLFTHWRGEIVKSNGQSTNGNLTIVNCIFRDGNATAINIYDSLLITNCLFDNLLQIGEYYQAYSTNTSYLVGNVFTNITGNGMAFNGGKGSNPAFVVSNNVFYGGGDGILTLPGDNIFVTSNQFYNTAWPIVIGAAGYQGTFINSNITINFNTFSNSSVVFQLGAYLPDNANVCSDINIYGNTSMAIRGSYLQSSWAYNVNFYSNTIPLDADGTTIIGTTLASGGHGSPFLLIQTNNQAWTRLLFSSTNQVLPVNYGQGSRFQFVYRTLTNSVLALTTTNASQIPYGAAMIITNSSFMDASSSGLLPVYLNSDLSGNPVVIGQNEAQTFYWNKVKGGYAWMTHPIIPPLNLRTNL